MDQTLNFFQKLRIQEIIFELIINSLFEKASVYYYIQLNKKVTSYLYKFSKILLICQIWLLSLVDKIKGVSR